MSGPLQRDFVRRFNRSGAGFPEATVSSYIRAGRQARFSQHRYGLAADIVFPGPPSRWPVERVAAAARAQGLVMIDERKRTSANWTRPHLHLQRFPGSTFRRMVEEGRVRA